MNAIRNFDPSALHAAELEQFDIAVRMTSEQRYVNVNFHDGYYFGSGLTSGVNVLPATHRQVGDDFTLLDVGYGNGTFLKEAAKRYPRAHMIGMAAVSLDELTNATAITGDIARSETWEPAENVPEAGTVDVAVSHLTFQHLANPIRGLSNVLNLMKSNGKLYIDHIRLSSNPSDFGDIADALRSALEGHVQYPSINSKNDIIGQYVSADFSEFTSNLDSIKLDAFKPYVDERGGIRFTV